LHAVVVLLLAQSWFEHDDPVKKVPRHVQASIVDMKTHKAQQTKASEDKAKKKADLQKTADAEKKRKAEQKKKQLAKEKADKKKADDKKRQQAIDKKKAADVKKKAEAKKKADQKRIEDAKIKKAGDKKRKAEEAAKKAKAAEVKRKADAKKAEAARKEAEAAAVEKAALIRAMEEEEAALLAEEQRASAMSYEAYIVDQVTRNWRRSPSARNGMLVEVTVHLLPSGRVNDRYVTKSSGDARFDEDALRAIDRVSIFEKLQDLDPVVFDRYFRKRVLRFRPEDLRD
jgi:colicin import membrane protein